MHDLVTVQAQDRGAQQLPGIGVHEYLHETLRLAHFAGAADPGHEHFRGEQFSSALLCFSLVHADPAERRVDEEGIAGYAVGDPARIVIEQVGGHDFIIIPGGMGERTLAVGIAHAPDAVRTGAALIVNRNVAACIRRDPRGFQPQVAGIGQAPHCEQQVAALGDRLAALAGHADDDTVALFFKFHALRAGAYRNALALEDRADLRCHVVVLARQQLVRLLHHRHLCAEAPVGLRELQADVAAADDEQVLGHPVDFHHAAVGKKRHVLDARHVRHQRASADVDENPVRRERVAGHVERARRREARMATDQGHVLHAGNPLGEAVDRVLNDAVLARLDGLHVHVDLPG